MKSAEELYAWGVRIKGNYVGKAFGVEIIKKDGEVLDFIDEVREFCGSVSIDKEMQGEIMAELKFVPGNPLWKFEDVLEKIQLLIQ